VKYYREDIQPTTVFGQELKRMVENEDNCDGNIYWLVEKAERYERALRRIKNEVLLIDVSNGDSLDKNSKRNIISLIYDALDA
jgi:hypothetical protein